MVQRRLVRRRQRRTLARGSNRVTFCWGTPSLSPSHPLRAICSSKMWVEISPEPQPPVARLAIKGINMPRFSPSFGGTTALAVDAFEERNRIRLPADYRELLIIHNGGRPVPSVCVVPELGEALRVDMLFGLGHVPSLDLDSWYKEYRSEMPPGFLVIGGVGPILFILGTQKPDIGVFCWDHSHVLSGSSEEAGNTYRIASTFTEFVNSLRSEAVPPNVRSRNSGRA